MRKLSTLSAIVVAISASLIFNSCNKDNEDPRASDEILFNPNLTYGTISDIDGNTYKTIEIGDQVWMAENLRVSQYNDGTSIPKVTDELTWTSTITPAYCWYDNKEETYARPYGALYNWYTVNTAKLCPTGWHIPELEEWETLTENLGGKASAGGKKKEIGDSHWNTPNSNATNSSGFSALPGGFRNSGDGNFYSLGENGYWWSSSMNFGNGWELKLSFYDGYTYIDDLGLMGDARSVRCLKD